MADELEPESVLAYAGKLAAELDKVADHLRDAVVGFQAVVRDFQSWVEHARGTAASPESEPTFAELLDAPPEHALGGQDVEALPLPQQVDRRSGPDRRNGRDRRGPPVKGLAARVIHSIDRRRGGERRSGGERRGAELPMPTP